MTPDQMRTAIKATIEANAKALNEAPTIGARFRADGTVLIQNRTPDGRWVRGEYREYTSIEAAYRASEASRLRAEMVAEMLANGVPKQDAITEAVYLVQS